MQQTIGVAIDDLRMPAKEGLQQAARMGFRAVEIGAARGELSPSNLSETGRRDVCRYLQNLGLHAAALTADAAGPGLADSAAVDAGVYRIQRILELAADLRVPAVTLNVGRLANAADDPAASIVTDALKALAEHTDRVGAVLAVQTGPASPDQLRQVLAGVGCPSLRVCLDPAMLACRGHDPSQAVAALADNIALSRLGDAVIGDPERAGAESAIGHGQLDLRTYLANLTAAGYHGPLILRRRDGDRPIDDLASGRQFVRSLLGHSSATGET